MDLKDLVSADDVFEIRERDKAHLLGEMARRAAGRLALDHGTVLQALVKRERLGSTGLGQGVAIPHARLDGVTRPAGFFALLRPAVHFDAIDDRPVDLVVLLLLPDAPPDGSLKPLACVARRLRDPVLADRLRGARGALSLYSLLAGS